MLFGKKKENVSDCGCGGTCNTTKEANTEDTGIIVLGSGCKKCNELEDNVKKALKTLGRDEEIKHITDFAVIAAYGVMSTPALVIDKKVVSYGKVLSEQEALDILRKAR